MRFREHRGGLQEAMETLREFTTGRELIDHIYDLLHPWYVRVDETTVHAQLYDARPDDRIEKYHNIRWPETWIVSVDGYGVVGMTDSDPKFPPPTPVHRKHPVHGS